MKNNTHSYIKNTTLTTSSLKEMMKNEPTPCMTSPHTLKQHSILLLFKYSFEYMQSCLSAYVTRTITESQLHFTKFENHIIFQKKKNQITI